MKKLILAGSAIAALAVPAAAFAVTPGPIAVQGAEGCVVVGQDTCTYPVNSSGGVAAHGNYTVTITYADTTKQPTVLNSSSTTIPQGCGLWTNASSGAPYTGVASVTLTVNDNQSGGAVGDPFITPLQGAGTTATGSC